MKKLTKKRTKRKLSLKSGLQVRSGSIMIVGRLTLCDDMERF